MPSRVVPIAALLALLLVPASARAAFPGRNGELTYDAHAGGRTWVYLRDSDGSDVHRLRATVRPSDPAFSPLGLRVAFGGSDGQLWVAYAEGKALRRLPTGVRPARDPAWSPAGDQLAFAVGPARAQDLFTIGADGTGLRQITFGAADEDSPAWSSRNELAFVRHAANGRGSIMVRPMAGGRTRRLTRRGNDDESPSWSAGGTRLAFTRAVKRKGRAVYVMRADGGRVRRVTKPAKGTGSPAFSPDGRWIAFTRGRRGGVFVVRSNGRRLHRVARGNVDPRAVDWQSIDHPPVVAAAGDIACDPASPAFEGGAGTDLACHQMQTSNLLLRADLSAVFALGDTQYEDGAYARFLGSFAPSWGRMKDLMHPVIGNHEARDAGGAGYYDYFDGPGRTDGIAGPRGLGYYSFDVGTWHIIALNSECSDVGNPPAAGICSPGSPQDRWLRADLAAHRNRCTLAMMHYPLISSGVETGNGRVQPLWQDLYAAGADVVLVGHDHAYERFAPMDPQARPDPARGIRQFVVGTGGRSHEGLKALKVNSEVRNDATFGVLELTLQPSSYSWTFVPEAGQPFTDSGTSACH